jgi:hypothetical protein
MLRDSTLMQKSERDTEAAACRRIESREHLPQQALLPPGGDAVS